MALEGLNTLGAYPVYDTSGSVNMYVKTMAQQQARRQAEQKAIQDQLGKVKIEGLRDPDKPIFYEKYNSWKSIPAKISQEKDPLKKMELQADFDKQFMELNDYAAKSREAEKDDDDFSGRALDDRFRNQFTDDAIAKVQKNRTLPINHPDYVRDKSVLARQIDTSKILEDLNKIDDQLLQSAKYDNPSTRRVKSGNKVGTESIYTRKVDPKVQALNYAMKYDTDRTFKAFIQKEYADVFKNTEDGDEAKAIAIQDLIGKRPLVKQDSPKMEWDRAPDNFYAHYDYRQANQTANKDSSILRQEWINDMVNGVAGSGERLKAFVEGSGKFGGKKLRIDKQDSSGNKLVFSIPSYDVMDKDGETVKETIPARKVTIDKNVASDKIKLNQFINEITGETVNISQLLTDGGKKKVAGLSDSKEIKEPVKVSDQDKAALSWLKANPSAPQAKAIRANLKSKGLIR